MEQRAQAIQSSTAKRNGSSPLYICMASQARRRSCQPARANAVLGAFNCRAHLLGPEEEYLRAAEFASAQVIQVSFTEGKMGGVAMEEPSRPIADRGLSACCGAVSDDQGPARMQRPRVCCGVVLLDVDTGTTAGACELWQASTRLRPAASEQQQAGIRRFVRRGDNCTPCLILVALGIAVLQMYAIEPLELHDSVLDGSLHAGTPSTSRGVSCTALQGSSKVRGGSTRLGTGLRLAGLSGRIAGRGLLAYR
ncbi:hypothetical protein PSPO01_10115 [Paraphaeosphaeria sporulosa]